ncbi:MAG TPA: sigma 54-interacting transcriptional regulator, partial [Thermoanaerobaculaceae bacterium]|nr:sigma 54-interacting transcriptional regulator [Thermoanaerobaculaceae bacterium]
MALRAEGHEAIVTGTLADAEVRCRDLRPDIVLLDLGLPDGDGLDLIPVLLVLCPLVRIIVLTGRDSVPAAVAALHAGARHYLVKPWDQEELLFVVAREARTVALIETTQREQGDQVFWGRHLTMTGLRAHLQKLAASPMTPLLIEGETGSGKEVVARELHRLAGAPGPFVALNCGAIPAELLESELFGHERGAFTGAESRRRGLVELAREGTLFLDEVGEMAPILQSKLLRFLEGHRFRRVGGEEE